MHFFFFKEKKPTVVPEAECDSAENLMWFLFQEENMKLQGDLRTMMDYGKVIIPVINLLLGNK